MPLSIATFNVKNLLPPRSDAERSRLPAKLDAVAATLRTANADVVALQEIGPTEIARALAGRLDGLGYGEPLLGPADSRGIRCATFTRAPVRERSVHAAESLPFPVFRAGDAAPFGSRIPLRRAVVHAAVEAHGLGVVHLLVAHFKSPLPVPLRDADGREVPAATPGDHAASVLRSLVWRAAEALYVRDLVDALMARDSTAHVVVAGDLNDTPESPVLVALRAAGPGELRDCTSGVPAAARFSVLHGGRGAQIDHVLASAALHARVRSAEFLNAGLRDHGSFDPGAEDEMSVDSDHAALVVRFG
jgi:endonuclease/exonuclease/phosphatase family metal-dependent hydrolase